MSEIYSHSARGGEQPRLLMDHLEGVHRLMSSEVERAKNYMDFHNLLGVDHKTLSFLVKAIAYLHDLGKATPEFQKKILNKPFHRDKTPHAALGAFTIGVYLSEEMPKELQYLIPLMVTLVKRHHGKAENPEFGCSFENEYELLEWQIRYIDRSFLKDLSSKIIVPDLNISDLEDFTNDWQDNYEDFFFEIDDIRPYVLYMYLSSLLRWADETDAAFRSRPLPKREDLPADIVEKYREINGFNAPGSDFMNKLRNKFYFEATKNLDFSIGSLKGRTGIGKTLTLFSLALKLRKKLKNKNYTPRIIYCLPFLSIIDQTYDVARQLFLETGAPEPSSSQILQQHHLVDIDFKTDNEDESYEKYLADLLINSWNSELTITTFVSFFHSIFTNKRNPRFFRIPGSIILLDEIQAIPPQYWDLTGKMMKLLSDYGGTKFVYSTATMPSCFGLSGSALYNGEIPLERFQLDRVGEMTFEDFKDELLPETIEEILSQKKSLMIVMNTINSAEATFKELLNYPDINKERLYFLSTGVPPKERRKRIEEIKNAKDFCILVTTQLVEAGVDLDFDYCIRDMGPLDSIVQVAGRVNRSNKKAKGKIKLIELTDFNGGRPPSMIYDPVLLSASKRAMSKNTYNEPELYELIENYFDEIDNESMGFKTKSRELFENIYKLEFSKIANFKLINDSGKTYPIFIELDNEAKKAWQEYTEIIQKPTSSEDKFKFLAEKKDIVRKLAPYIINYRPKHDDDRTDLPPILNGFCYVQKDELERYYDKKTGFHPAGCDFY